MVVLVVGGGIIESKRGRDEINHAVMFTLCKED